MKKNQCGFAHHFLLLFMIIAALVFVGWRVSKAQHSPTSNQIVANSISHGSSSANPGSLWASPQVYGQLPNCQGNQLLSNMPIENGVPYEVIPLGNISPGGGHVYPADHMYVDFEGRYGTYNLVSPGNVYVTKIRRISRTVNGVNSADDSIYMMPCKQVAFYFNHVQASASLSAAIPNTNDPKTNDCAFAGQQNSHQNTQTNSVGSDCSQLATTLVKFQPGQLFATATASQTQAGLDFGAIDARAPQLKLINPATEGDTQVSNGLTYLKSVCPISYLPAAVQQTVFAKEDFAARPMSDKCGDIAQDKLGTVQGNWYQGAPVTYTADWAKELAVLHYNRDPSIAQVSVGGTLGSGGMFTYTPSTSGTINPEPSATKIGPLYCFTSNVPANTPALEDASYSSGHKILLQLTSSRTMKAEYQTGSCSGHDGFASPVAYSR